jgi:hypothetical protein
VTRTGKGKTERTDKGVGVVGVEAEVGQTLVGVGMGMIGENPRMIDGIAVDVNQMVGLERAMIVSIEIVVTVANHVHIDMSGRVAHQLAERTRSLAEARGRHDIHQALVLHPCPRGMRVVEGTREEGTPVPGRARQPQARSLVIEGDHLQALVQCSLSRGRGPWVRSLATAAMTDPATRGWILKVVFPSLFQYVVIKQHKWKMENVRGRFKYLIKVCV